MGFLVVTSESKTPDFGVMKALRALPLWVENGPLTAGILI